MDGKWSEGVSAAFVGGPKLEKASAPIWTHTNKPDKA